MFNTSSRQLLAVQAYRLSTLQCSACRNFAWNSKWKQKAPRRKDKRRSEDQIYVEKLKKEARRFEIKRQEKVMKRRAKQGNITIEDAIGPQLLAEEATTTTTTPAKVFVPPAMLLPTGSPHAYVSKLTAQASDIDPRELFPPSEMEKMPALFRQNTFVYDGVELLNGEEAANNNKRGDSPRTTFKNIPQVAFLGRSNVGKSSLVNALMRRDLARCSKQPGRTQQVHRFALVPNQSTDSQNTQPDKPWGLFLDLPGYGFAVAPDDVLDNWQSRTQQILRREYREGNLKRVFLLIDARQGVTDVDQDVLSWLEETGGMPHTLVWTKSDAVSKPQLIKGLNQAFMWYQQRLFVAEEEGAPCCMSPIIHTTSTKGAGQGLFELLSAIEAEFLVEDD